MGENDRNRAWDQESLSIERLNEQHFGLGGNSKLLDGIVNQYSSARAQKTSHDGTGAQTTEMLTKYDEQEIQDSAVFASGPERLDAVFNSNRERIQMYSPQQRRSIRGSGSIPTQIATDDPLDHLDIQHSVSSLAADESSMEFGGRQIKLHNETIGTGCFYDLKFVEYAVLDPSEQVQNDLDKMSLEQEIVDGYAPVSFLLWFSASKSYSDILSESLGRDNDPSPADWLVSPWLMILLALSKVQSLIYGTRLYCCLRKIPGVSDNLLLTVDLTSAAKEHWDTFATYGSKSSDQIEPRSHGVTNKMKRNLFRTDEDHGLTVPEGAEVFDELEVSKTNSLELRNVAAGSQIPVNPLWLSTNTEKSTQSPSPMRQKSRLKKNISMLKLEIRGNKRVSPRYPCKLCQEVFGVKVELENHIAEEHLPCDFCDRWFADSTELINHYDAKHQFVCYHPLCRRRSFRNQRELSIHLEVMHLDDSGSTSTEDSGRFHPKLTEEPLPPFDLAKSQQEITQPTYNPDEYQRAPVFPARVPWN